ncbi:EAL domain-containing protein [Methylobacter sp. S3L5C]|uniref:EAL domain-containing protein n=1 Tax=Methylobacter sp. S3L5C TaxID=2839024 RepID=UPI001FAB56D5|nr:EAL domain-containing protein [Methylobacter sp. S3L5C]UOA09454.1 EAL domain-containing protein [Methylobacter sp. S3L5C]
MPTPIDVNIRISMTNPPTVLSIGDNIDALLGFTVTDFLNGKVSLQSRIHTADQDIADVLFSTDCNKTTDTFNIRLRHANGHIRCVKGIYRKQPDATNDKVILDLLLQDAKSLIQNPDDQAMMTHFKAMMENTDDYIYFKDRNHVLTGASQTLATLTDRIEQWSELLGKTDYDLFPEKDADIYYQLEKQVFAGIPVAYEIQKIPNSHDHRGWIDNRKYPIYDDNGKISGLFGIARDVSTRINTERFAQFYGNILEQLAINKPLQIILDAVVLGVEQLYPTLLCSILLLDSDSKHLINGSAPNLPDFYIEVINGLEIGVGVGCCGEAAFTGKRVIVENIATHDNWASWKALAARAGLGSCWSQPILSSSAQILGTFAIYHPHAHIPTEFDITIIEQSASLAGIAIERRQTDAALARSETKFRTLFNTSTDAVFMLNKQGFFNGNDAAIKMFGLTSQEDIALYHPLDLSPLKQPCGTDSKILIKQYLETALKKGSLRFEWMHKRVDNGKNFITEVLLSSMILDGELLLQIAIHDITIRKRAEDELRIAATAFQIQEGMMVTDAKGILLRVNNAFTTITGYLAQEVLGKNPRFLNSGRHDVTFYKHMWNTVNNSGTWSGEIWNRRKSGEVYPEYLTIISVKDNYGEVINYVATLTDITMSKVAAEEIRHLAYYDPLTQLANRRLLTDRVKHTLAFRSDSSGRGAVMFIDLDHFKTINDTLGHNIGDLLLQQVASRLAACVRKSDTLARLGGDEFVVLLENLSEKPLEAAAQAKVIGDKILGALRQPYQLATHEYYCTASIGVTFFNDYEIVCIDELFRQADIAMYKAKDCGRNHLCFFDPDMQRTITANASLTMDLRNAIEQRQFQLYYQVQVDALECPIGAEALIRWHHPERGMVPPHDFIALAEQTGLILPIGQWVLETACAQLKAWEQDESTCKLTLSINVSAKQFLEANFVSQVKNVVQHHSINPAKLKLELTESMLADNLEQIIAVMNTLNAFGIRFSLDDFGTGYSSLQYLKRLPLFQLKIDQSFVRDITFDGNDRALVLTIINMANNLGLEVIAEGVETKEQQDILLNKGCHHFQGYLFGKPVPVKQFEEALKQKCLLGLDTSNCRSLKGRNGLIKQDTSKDSFIMSTEVSMINQTKQKRPNYTIECKQDTTDLVNEKGYKHQQAADNMDISLSAIGRWVKAKQGSRSPSAINKSLLNLTDQGELTQLREEVEQLRMECEILQQSALKGIGTLPLS